MKKTGNYPGSVEGILGAIRLKHAEILRDRKERDFMKWVTLGMLIITWIAWAKIGIGIWKEK